jgi:hypothetical protein
VRPRRQGLALLCGPSTSPLDVVNLLRLVCVVCLVGLAGCVPAWPRATPTVTGRVELHGAPISGADVYLVRWFHACEVSQFHTVTSSDGTFAIAGTHEFEWIVPGDHFVRWAVCFNVKGQWFVGYGESHMGFPVSRVQLTCDLSAPVVEGFRAKPDRRARGLCRADDV